MMPPLASVAGDRPEADSHIDIGKPLVFEQGHRPGLGLADLGKDLATARSATDPVTGYELPLRILLTEIVFHGGLLP